MDSPKRSWQLRHMWTKSLGELGLGCGAITALVVGVVALATAVWTGIAWIGLTILHHLAGWPAMPQPWWIYVGTGVVLGALFGGGSAVSKS